MLLCVGALACVKHALAYPFEQSCLESALLPVRRKMTQLLLDVRWENEICRGRMNRNPIRSTT